MTAVHESFPRQYAMTRGFRLGAPRAFRVGESPNRGARVAFVRSPHGRAAAGDLWVADAEDGYRARLVVSSRDLASGSDVPAAERARRERLREVTSGITGYSWDARATLAVFAVDGAGYLANLDDGNVEHLPFESAVVDPQISPDARFVALVADGAVHVWALATGEVHRLSPVEGAHVTWGLADFIAAEEFGRHRGLWWLPDSTGVIAQRVDASAVREIWLSDPAQPESPPTPHRYPAAGTQNAEVSLHLIGVDGETAPLAWDVEACCYLIDVHVASETDVLVTTMSRDQRHRRTYELRDGILAEIDRRTQDPWVAVIPGVPTRDADRCFIDVHDVDGSRVLTRDGLPCSPLGWHVEAVINVSQQGVLLQAAHEPETRVIARVSDGQFAALTPIENWAAATASGDVRVEVQSTLTRSGAQACIVDGSHRVPVESFAEVPSVRPKPRLVRVGSRGFSTAILLPASHVDGDRWPVICSPYGGPHAQRVVSSANAYLTEQWLADQGFAVVIADGRGTPGRGSTWEYAVSGNLADPVLIDQVDALFAAGQVEPALDLTRVGIRGWSFGGYLAALAVLDRPDVFHAAVAGAPVTDWRLYDTAYTERYLGDPSIDDGPYQKSSLIERASRLSRPLLLIHGLADDNVIAAHTLLLSAALLAEAKPHNVLPLSGVTHMTPQEIVAENLLWTEVEFFRKNL